MIFNVFSFYKEPFQQFGIFFFFLQVCKIHRQLPPGAILVFMTGEKEVQGLCKVLRKTFPFRAKTALQQEEEDKASSLPTESKSPKKKKSAAKDSDFCDILPEIDLDK